MAGRSLNPATRRRLGGPLPRLLPDGPRPHPAPQRLSREGHAALPAHPVLIPLSGGYPGARGRLVTCYSPVRHSISGRSLFCTFMRRCSISGITTRFQELFRCKGQVSHPLLTRSPLSWQASLPIPFDLHVLSTPPAFVLSQNQTLH